MKQQEEEEEEDVEGRRPRMHPAAAAESVLSP